MPSFIKPAGGVCMQIKYIHRFFSWRIVRLGFCCFCYATGGVIFEIPSNDQLFGVVRESSPQPVLFQCQAAPISTISRILWKHTAINDTNISSLYLNLSAVASTTVGYGYTVQITTSPNHWVVNFIVELELHSSNQTWVQTFTGFYYCGAITTSGIVQWAPFTFELVFLQGQCTFAVLRKGYQANSKQL